MRPRPAFPARISRTRRLGRDRRGVAAVEFALLAPVLLVALMGIFDLAYTVYTSALLEGAIQKAARDSTIEGAGGHTDALDDRVTEVVNDIAPHAHLAFSRQWFTSFTDVRPPEDFTDVNANGTCDGGEPYEDVNGNGTWDQNRGQVGNGGARDAVVYEVQVTYRRLFPIAGFLGQSEDFTLVTHTVLRNQPYGLQAGAVLVPRNCP